MDTSQVIKLLALVLGLLVIIVVSYQLVAGMGMFEFKWMDFGINQSLMNVKQGNLNNNEEKIGIERMSGGQSENETREAAVVDDREKESESWAEVEEKRIEELLKKRKDDLPRGFEKDDLSPYFGKFYIQVSGSSNPNVYPEKLILRASNLETEALVNVTGWKFYSNTKWVTVPQAIADFKPFSRYEEDIVIRRGESVTLYSTKGEEGKNIRPNRCFGYLRNKYDFRPAPVPSSCYNDIDRSQFYYLSGECQDFVARWAGRCETPSASALNKIKADGGECRARVMKVMTYTSCYKNHKNDGDFFLPNWYAWVDKSILDPRHDWVVLVDETGKLVADYRY